MSSDPRSARTLLLIALVACGVIGAGGFVVLSNSDDLDYAVEGGEGEVTPLRPLPEQGTARAARDRAGTDAGEGDEDPLEEDIVSFAASGSRGPHGDVYHVTAETLSAAVDAWHREEMMRMVDVLQKSGETIPQEIVDLLIEKLERSDLALDALAVLGRIDDDTTGAKLASFAADPSRGLDERRHALAALAKSGQAGARPTLIALVSSTGVDRALLRAALPALAATGGNEAATAIGELLIRDGIEDRGLRGPLLGALAATEGSSPVLASMLERARESRDADVAGMVLLAAQQQGEEADATVRSLVRNVMLDELAGGIAPDGDEAAARRLRAEAIGAAAAMGGDLLPEVVRLALEGQDGIADAAAHGLRNARGEEAADLLAGAVDRAPNERIRYQLVDALGATGSRSATPKLTALLDDEVVNVRMAAAKALSDLRDPKAAPDVLERLNRTDEHAMARSLVDALGRMGAKKALPRLQQMWDAADEGDAEMKNLEPFVRRAIKRIETGNPDHRELAVRK